MLKKNKVFEFTYKSNSYIGICRPDNRIDFNDNHTRHHPIIAAIRTHPIAEFSSRDEIFPQENSWSELETILKQIGVTYTELPSMMVVDSTRLLYINPKTKAVYLNTSKINDRVIKEFINSGTISIGKFVGIFRVLPAPLQYSIKIGCTLIPQAELNVIRNFLKTYYKLPMKKKVVKESYLNITK